MSESMFSELFGILKETDIDFRIWRDFKAPNLLEKKILLTHRERLLGCDFWDPYFVFREISKLQTFQNILSVLIKTGWNVVFVPTFRVTEKRKNVHTVPKNMVS